jgi:hypothetical protein
MATLPVYIYGDTANDILNVARQRVNELVLTAQGFPGGADPGQQFTEVGGGPQAVELNADGSLILRTQLIFNAAWRKFQKYLSNLGYRLLIADNIVVANIPANAQGDPTIQSWISWNGNFNGTAFASTPALPLDFYAPLRIQERVNGSASFFSPMGNTLQGLRNNFARGALNRQWEWRSNALYVPGATGATDLQLRYTRRLPDLPDPNYYVSNTPWYEQQIPIPDSLSPLAWFVAYEALLLRGTQDMADAAAIALQNGRDEADEIFNDQARADQRPKLVQDDVARSGSSGGPGTSGKVS